MEENKPIGQPLPAANVEGAVTQPPAGKNTIMAFVAYILFFIPLLTESKNDPFVKFHVKQSLGVLLLWVATLIIDRLPFVWVATPFLQIAVVVLWIIGIVYALQGKQQALPLVGRYFEKLNF
ncbi:MAG: hypothetical protein HY983_00285 [Candidatus Magasanikbacteria bacterium]|nr:hypothetical protein [Candidatus Magasanikbacteria bacterium]